LLHGKADQQRPISRPVIRGDDAGDETERHADGANHGHPSKLHFPVEQRLVNVGEAGQDQEDR
jgi:hypothetical protein